MNDDEIYYLEKQASLDEADADIKRDYFEEVSADWKYACEHVGRCAVRRRAIRPHLHRRLQRGRNA